jgi:hypothetical protein
VHAAVATSETGFLTQDNAGRAALLPKQLFFSPVILGHVVEISRPVESEKGNGPHMDEATAAQVRSEVALCETLKSNAMSK